VLFRCGRRRIGSSAKSTTCSGSLCNHPNLKRILLPEDWVGYPLRKDYNIRLQDVEWVRKHLGIDSGQKYYVGEARHEDTDTSHPAVSYFIYVDQRDIIRYQ